MDRLKSGIYDIDVSTVGQQVEEKLSGKNAGTFETNGESVKIEINVP